MLSATKESSNSSINNLITFVIPALNEEEHMGDVIQSIKQFAITFPYDIIVIDNGSTDRTVDIAKKHGAHVLIKPNIRISQLRNLGGHLANSRIIVFLDADVYLTNNWGLNIDSAVELLNNHPMTITGSICGISHASSWIERHWYGPILSKSRVNYINSGHLIVTQELFQRLGGFNETLETGEDYEFCERALKVGATIINNPDLKVIHLGYPKYIADFFRRELWHGRGDYMSFKNIIKSRPAILSLSQLLILLISLCSSIYTGEIQFLYIYVLYMLVICTGSAFLRCRTCFFEIPACSLLYGVYFIARSISFLDVMFSKGKRTGGFS